MSKYIIKRILIAIPVLIGITIIDYAIMCMAGSPLEMLKGPRVSEAALEAKKIAPLAQLRSQAKPNTTLPIMSVEDFGHRFSSAIKLAQQIKVEKW